MYTCTSLHLSLSLCFSHAHSVQSSPPWWQQWDGLYSWEGLALLTREWNVQHAYVTHWVHHLYCTVCSYVVNYYIQYTYCSVCVCVCVHVCGCACVSWTLLHYYTDQPPAVHWQAYHSTSLPLSSQSWQYSWLEQQFKCWPHHPTRLYRHFSCHLYPHTMLCHTCLRLGMFSLLIHIWQWEEALTQVCSLAAAELHMRMALTNHQLSQLSTNI